jgi:hypothetical protein
MNSGKFCLYLMFYCYFCLFSRENMFFIFLGKFPKVGAFWGGNYGWGKALFVRLRHKKKHRAGARAPAR